MRIYGAKGGGGSSRTPVEAPETGRSKQIVNIVELLCEGEIEGLVDGFKSIYLDGTKIQNDDGSYNFNNVSGQLNVGTQDQEVLDSYDSSQNEVNVGVEVKKKNGAIVRTVTDGRVNRLRLTLGVRSLFHQNNQGDTNTASVSLKITIGSQQHTHTFNGKYSSQYLESVVFDNLPPVPFQIKVERVTADSDSQRLQNGTVWSSYTEIIDTEFTYPNSAVAGISFDSEYFNSIPTRNYLIKAKKVKVPSNYDPIKRTYTGFWDGTFKIAWTDNPAWEIYDLGPILSKMLGVEISFDKWALYDVSRYCDQLVPDGMGGMEPRFTCNVWLTEVKTAYDLLNDFCSVFRAIPIWNGTEVSVIIDRPRDPVWTYTNANVVGGFERSYSARKSRHNAVQVTYSDKNNGYESAVEYISDDDEIRKHGLNLSQVTAFGCTSRGQAYRTGKWILETEKREKETITFTVGREGLMHLPGDIIRVADGHYAGTEIGGRVLAVNGRKVTLDREISIDNTSYFTYINAEATHSTIKIRSVKGKEITLDSNPTGLEIYGVWSLSTQQLTSGLYRSISIVENADGTNTITALQHEPQKESIVDNAAHFVETARTLYKAPQINTVEVSTGYDGKLYISSDISSGDGKLTYDIKITKEGNLYQYKKGLSEPNIELSDLPNGDYSVIIYGKNGKGQIVTEKTQTFTIDRPPTPTGVIATGGLGTITLEWNWVNEATQTEIFVAETDNFALAKKIAKVTARTYAHTVKGNKAVRYYWLRHTRGINVGPFYQERGVKGESAVDLDTKLDELNVELSRNIIDEVFDVAAPARGLELVKTVANLTNKNTKLESNQVYNQADGKLYTWNGTAYSATVPASDITGIIPRTKIDTTLISQLNTATSTANTAKSQAESAQSAINAEVSNRTRAIQAESANLTRSIQAEATARGTAITQLQNVDSQQAQLISAATAKADNALSGLEEEKTARVNGDRAEAQARGLLTTRVGTAEGAITTLQRNLATATQSISEVSQNLHSKIDNLSVGGRNLITGTPAMQIGRGTRASATFRRSHNATFQSIVVTDSPISTQNAMQIQATVTTGFGGGFAQDSLYLPVDDYTISAWVKGTAGDVVILQPFWANGQPGRNKRFVLESSEWVRISYTATATTAQIYSVGYVYLVPQDTQNTLSVLGLKLERGTIATDWTPAPEDVESTVSAVSADLTTYKQTQASTDLAQSQQITTLTSRMSGAESNITRNATAITTLNQSTATQFNTLNSKVANSEGAITAIQSTKANKSEVASIAQSSLQAVWKADVKSAVDGVKVGGRNYLLGGLPQAKHWYYSKHSSSRSIGNKEDGYVSIDATNDNRLGYWKQWQQFGYDWGNFEANPLLNELRPNELYTVSFWAKNSCSENIILNINIRYDVTAGSAIHGFNQTVEITSRSDWTRYSVSQILGNTFPENYKGSRFLLVVSSAIPDGELMFKQIKLEQGTIATDWTPAPEDVESSVSAVSAKVDSVQQTLANADSALSSRIDTVNASVGSNSSKITQVSNAVASVDGKLSATHTIKTETIAGGRKAIAGIALGATADNRNAESSVIVMADKFEVVKNAQDGTPVRLFGVVENKVAINGNLIATGSISGDHINANSVRTAVLTAGAIRTEHLAAGQISADKLAIGLGGNLLYNPIFANDAHGWGTHKGSYSGGLLVREYLGQGNDDWAFKNAISDQERMVKMTFRETIVTPKNQWADVCRQRIRLVPNQWYMFSVYVNAYHCSADLRVEEYTTEGDYVRPIVIKTINNNGSFTHGVHADSRNFVKFQCPVSGHIDVIIRGNKQTGSNPHIYAARPMLEECTEHATAPSAWQNAGVTAIHGGSIVTNTVTAQQIAAHTITANEIATGTIAARNMAVNSINASHIVSGSITADKLNVTNLSAINSNLGTVTAGTITGTTITGNTISGGTINGTTITGTSINGGAVKGSTIEGGIIRGARIEGLTIEAQNIIGDVIKVYSAKYRGGKKETISITIPASTRQRIAYIMPVLILNKWDATTSTTNFVSVSVKQNGIFRQELNSRYGYVVLQGTLAIPANTSTKIEFYIEHSTHQVDSGVLPPTEFIVFCNNA